MKRRGFLASAAAVTACASLRPFGVLAQPRPLVYADMHSHLGLLGPLRANIRETMTANGMLVIARKIIADGPVIRRIPGKGTQQVREPAAGVLAANFDNTLARMKVEHKSENVVEITDAASFERVMKGGEPGVVLASEGGDFIDGDMKRLEAARREGLVHLQLVHYRVSDIGDISTDRPVHNGLSSFGLKTAEIRNVLGGNYLRALQAALNI